LRDAWLAWVAIWIISREDLVRSRALFLRTALAG
jgi:hypothetical protein